MNRRFVVALCALLTLLSGMQAAVSEQSAAQRARIFATLPDWAGFWETELSAQVISGLTGQSSPSSSSAPKAAQAAAARSPASADAFVLRTNLLGAPPYNSEWKSKTQRPPTREGSLSDPLIAPTTKFCSGGGFPNVMESPVPDGMFQVLVTPEETVLLFADGETRQIYTDGRAHPKTQDLWPTAMGDAIGHWQGATLIVHTVARKAGPVAPIPGAADLSDEAQFTERLRQVDANTMQNEMTIDDPSRFSHRWRFTIRYKRVTDVDRMIVTNCTDNDRNPVVDGRFVIAPP